MAAVFFTSSWDDGHPLDLRVAELLSKHGFTGTFYVPGRNPGGHCTPDGLPVLSAAELNTLGSEFEIGSHTLDHQFLDEVSEPEAKRQIDEGKKELESQLGRAITGFCYPGGRYSEVHSRLVREAGFRYARTIENLQAGFPSDPYSMSTTIQFYPHRPQSYLKNYVKFGHWGERSSLLIRALRYSDLRRRMEALLDRVCAAGGVFHLWGHSWEIDVFKGWGDLDSFLRAAADRIPNANRLSNCALFDRSLVTRR